MYLRLEVCFVGMIYRLDYFKGSIYLLSVARKKYYFSTCYTQMIIAQSALFTKIFITFRFYC